MDKKLIQLVVAATRRTQDGLLTWKPFDEETFRTPVADGYLHVRRDWPRGDQTDEKPVAPIYSLEVSDNQGRVGLDARVTPGNPDYEVVEALFRAARSSGFGTDHVLDNMLHFLGAGQNR